MKILRLEQIKRLTYEELKERIPRSLERLQTLQGELEQENKFGSTMTDHEYDLWRGRTLKALRQQTVEYQRLREARSRFSQGDSPTTLLKLALAILKDVDDLEADDLLVCNRIELWLSTRTRHSAVVAPPADERPGDVAGGKSTVGIASGGHAPEQ